MTKLKESIDQSNQAKTVKKETFQQLAERFGVKTPAQLRDQVIWQGIREIRRLLDPSRDTAEILKKQDEIFRTAQEEESYQVCKSRGILGIG